MAPAGAPAYVPLSIPRSYKRYTRVEHKVPFASGADGNSTRIDPAGLLLGLLINISGTIVTSSTKPALHPEAPFNLIKRITLQGGNPGSVISIPGYPLRVLESVREADYVPTFSFAPVDSDTVPFSFDVMVPVCVRDGDLYGGPTDYLGAIFTGDPTLSLGLQIDWATEADVFTTHASTSTITAQATVSSFKLDTPVPSADPGLLAAVSWQHRLISEQENVEITGSGPLSKLNPLPSAQPRAYLRVLDIVRNNGVPVNGVIASIDAELQDTINYERNVPEAAWLARQNRRYTVPPNPGTYCSDFAAGNRRDNWLPVGAINLFTINPTISDAPTLSSASFNRYSECVVPSALANPFMLASTADVLKLTSAGA
jgi:hypothetical protein